MTEEIKEILDKLKLLCYDDYCLEFSVDYIERKEEKILLDYITNLQQKLEQYEKTQTYGDYVETVNKVAELQQENKELKAIAEEHKNCTRKHWQEKCGEHHAKELIYKSRCEKANKWIDKHTEIYTKNGISIIDWDNLSDPRELKNILNGSDE